MSVATEQHSDTGEIYRVQGCGKTGQLHCSAPDYMCLFAPDP